MVEGCVALGRLRGPSASHLSRTSKKGCGYKAVQATLAKRSSAVTGPSSRPKATVKSMVPVQGRAQQEAWGGGLGKASATQAKCRLPAAPCEGVLRMRSCRQWQSTSQQGRAVQLQVAVLGRASPLRIFSRTASERVPTVQCYPKCKIGNNSECDA